MDGDWWYDDSYDWSSDWSWYDDSFWQPPNWTTEVQQAALPPPFQPIASQASSAAKAAPIAPQAQPQAAAAVIASPPGLADPSHIADESLIASSSSGNSRGSGIARTARPGIAKLFVGALMLIGTLSSSVPVIPEHAPLSAPTFSAAPLSSSTSSSQDERIDIHENIDELPDQDRLASPDQVLSGVLGFCLTAVLLQIVVHHGLLKTTHCFLLAVIAPSFEAFRVRHWTSDVPSVKNLSV